MKTKNINLKWFLILPLIFVTINSCKKEEEVVTPPPADDYKLTVFNNQTGNPSADALHAQIVNTQQNYQINFYGTFLGDNSPDQANTVTYHKDGNDTIVYLLLDPTSHKLQTAYIEVSGLKQPWVIKHEYIAGNDNAITVSIYDYNWITNTGVLKYQATHETNNGVHTETPLYAKANHLYGIGAIGVGFVVAEAVFYGTGVGFLGTAAGAALVGAVGPIVAVGLTLAVVVGAIAVITSGNANAAALEPGDYPYPPNTPVNNPAPPTNNPNNPTPNLPPTPCTGVVITFNASMDQFGSILISNPTGGSGFQYSLANSAFQQSQVFNGPYIAGSYLIMVKNGDGCIKAEVRNIDAYQVDCSTLQISLNQSGASLSATASGGQSPYTFKFANSFFSSSQNYTVNADGKYQVIAQDANSCYDTAYISVCDVQLTNVAIVSNTGSGYSIEISYQSPLGLIPEFTGPSYMPLLLVESTNYSSWSLNLNDYCSGVNSFPYLNPGFISTIGDQYNKTIRYSIPASSTTGTTTRTVSFRLPGQCFSDWNCLGNPTIKASQLYTLQWLEN